MGGDDWNVDPDWEFSNSQRYSVADLARIYEAACQRRRTVAAGHSLDDRAVSRSGRSLCDGRWFISSKRLLVTWDTWTSCASSSMALSANDALVGSTVQLKDRAKVAG